MMNLNNIKKSEMVFTSNAHIKVERTSLGAVATVKSGRLSGKHSFDLTPNDALAGLVQMLKSELDYGYFTDEQRIADRQLDRQIVRHLDKNDGVCGNINGCDLCATYAEMMRDA